MEASAQPEAQEPVIGGAAPVAAPPPVAVEPSPPAAAAVPAGAPPRALSRPGTPFEKIRAGLARL